MATFNKYQQFVEDLGNKVHDLVGTNDTLKVALSNTTPDPATHQVLSQVAEISAGNGYTAGGLDTSNDGTESGGTLTVTGTDVTWTANGGSIGPFRYVVLYNDTPSAPQDPLIGWWDYSNSITLANNESFTVDFGSNTLFTIS